MRGKARSWQRTTELTPPWGFERPKIDTLEIVKSELLVWEQSFQDPLRRLFYLLWGGKQRCLDITGDKAPMLSDLLAEGFAIMLIRGASLAGFTFLAAVDSWLSNCRLSFGYSESLQSLQEEIDRIRDIETERLIGLYDKSTTEWISHICGTSEGCQSVITGLYLLEEFAIDMSSSLMRNWEKVNVRNMQNCNPVVVIYQLLFS